MQAQHKRRETIVGKTQLFAEEFSKFQVRDYSNNTRMNIKNQDYASQKLKRDRAMNYWQNQVIQNYLPPIDAKKKNEMNELRRLSGTVGIAGMKTNGKSPPHYNDKMFPSRQKSNMT